ncbi:MAG: ABC transporter substrate-binding protein [Chloroflexota bacterium]
MQHDPVDFGGQVSKTTTTLSGGSGSYDILEMYTSVIPQYAAAGKLVPLDDLFAKYKDKYQLGELDPTMLEQLRYQGKLYALPTQANVTVLAYRKDIFQQLGLEPPKTFVDIISDAQKIKQAGTMEYPVALPLLSTADIGTMFRIMMNSQGQQQGEDATKMPNFTSPAATKALQTLRDLAPYMDPQVTTFDQPKVQQQLFNGQAAIAMMFSGRMADLLDKSNTQYYDKFGFAVAPSVEPGGKAAASLSVDGWSIPANTKLDKDLLFQVVAASVSADAAKNSLPAAYPSRTSVISDTQLPYSPAVQQALKNGAAAPQPYAWAGPLQTQTSPIITGGVTGAASIDATLAEAQRLGTEVIKSTGG